MRVRWWWRSENIENKIQVRMLVGLWQRNEEIEHETQDVYWYSFITYSHGKLVSFGQILSIFVHRCCKSPTDTIMETWLHVQSFPPIPSKLHEPFETIQEPNVKAYLCMWQPTKDQVVELSEVIAHCAWLMYKPKEVNLSLNLPTVALLSMER